jgi:hypothetical protein
MGIGVVTSAYRQGVGGVVFFLKTNIIITINGAPGTFSSFLVFFFFFFVLFCLKIILYGFFFSLIL